MPASTPPRFNVLGVQVHAVDYATAISAILRAAHTQTPFASTALAVHGVMTGYHDPQQRARINALDLVTPDGQPVRWALAFLHGIRLADRVYGPFLMSQLCQHAAAQDIPVFLYGSGPQTLASLHRALQMRFPALRLVGARPSRFRIASDSEWQADVAALRDSGARLVFCGLGCPRQEAWVHAMRSEVNAALVAVGAAFPLWAGERRMAPAWMQRTGLEWFFRLATEPRRLAKRYLVYNPLFIDALVRQKLRRPTRCAPGVEPSAPPLRWS